VAPLAAKGIVRIGFTIASSSLVAALLSCNGKATGPTPLDGSSAGGPSLSGGARGAGGAPESGGQTGAGGVTGAGGTAAASGCPQCPSQPALKPCCEDFCGYRNDQLGECVPSVVGGRTLTVVEAPSGKLCVPRLHCDQSAGCTNDIPAEGSICNAAMTCHYCMGANIARAVTCSNGRWSTVGPNKSCNAYTDPTR
jgi:hypothetical protein